MRINMKPEGISPEEPAVLVSPYEGETTDIIRRADGSAYSIAVRNAEGYLIGAIASMTENQIRRLRSQITAEIGGMVYLTGDQIREVVGQEARTLEATVGQDDAGTTPSSSASAETVAPGAQTRGGQRADEPVHGQQP